MSQDLPASVGGDFFSYAQSFWNEDVTQKDEDGDVEMEIDEESWETDLVWAGETTEPVRPKTVLDGVEALLWYAKRNDWTPVSDVLKTFNGNETLLRQSLIKATDIGCLQVDLEPSLRNESIRFGLRSEE